MPHGLHIYPKASDMAKATMYEYQQSDHELPHLKCVMRRCEKYTSADIPDQETDDKYSKISPSIFFHIYHLIVRCTLHGRLMLN